MRNDIVYRLGAAILSPALMGSAGILNSGAKGLIFKIHCLSPLASTLAIYAVRHYIDNQNAYAVNTFIKENNL